MERRDKLLAAIDLPALTGLEVGPLNRPLVRRTDGPIVYVDHADTPALRLKYAGDPNVDIDEIVEVDAVWGSGTLREAVGRNVDYVVASHVIEHVPDLISWLAEVSEVLTPRGELRLAVPDRRFTFDYNRSETRLSDVVHAWSLKPRVPLPTSILDFCLEVGAVDPIAAWQGAITPPSPMYGVNDALNLAKDARENGAYHDVHCWVFTPISFARLLGRLAKLGLMNFSCEQFFETERNSIEFIVHARRCDDAAKAAASWADAVERLQSSKRPELAVGDGTPAEMIALLRRREADIAALEQTVRSLSAELDEARRQAR